MLTHARAAAALRRVPPSVLLQPPNLSAALLEASARSRTRRTYWCLAGMVPILCARCCEPARRA
jgi:hypothetical protein